MTTTDIVIWWLFGSLWLMLMSYVIPKMARYGYLKGEWVFMKTHEPPGTFVYHPQEKSDDQA